MVIAVPGVARVVAAVAAGGILLAAALAPRASAAPVEESGYWWRLQLGSTPVAPAGVEEGQLHVAADAVGTSAVAALRARVDADSLEALVLREVASSGSPMLRACATSGWTKPSGGGAGPFSDRPSDERCSTDVVQGARSDDGVWTFDVAPLVSAEGVLDVVIVPGIGEQSVTFAAPDDGTLVVRKKATTPSLTDEPAPAFTSPSDDSGAGSSGDIGDTPLRTDRASIGGSVLEPVAPVLSTPAMAAPIAGAPASAFDDDVQAYPAPRVTATPASEPGKRAPLALVAVALVIGAWVYRTRAALAAAGEHPLSASLTGRAAELAGAAARFDEVALT